jgi:hypothetical protein
VSRENLQSMIRAKQFQRIITANVRAIVDNMLKLRARRWYVASLRSGCLRVDDARCHFVDEALSGPLTQPVLRYAKARRRGS